MRFLTKDGKEITFGDIVRQEETYKKEGYYKYTICDTVLNEDNVNDFLEKGIISVVDEDKFSQEEEAASEELTKTLALVMKKIKVEEDTASATTWNRIIEQYKGAVLNMVLMEYAKKTNKKYKGSLYDCEVIYAVSPVNGKITEVISKDIIDWSLFAAFKNKQDAENAAKWIRHYE